MEIISIGISTIEIAKKIYDLYNQKKIQEARKNFYNKLIDKENALAALFVSFMWDNFEKKSKICSDTSSRKICEKFYDYINQLLEHDILLQKKAEQSGFHDIFQEFYEWLRDMDDEDYQARMELSMLDFEESLARNKKSNQIGLLYSFFSAKNIELIKESLSFSERSHIFSLCIELSKKQVKFRQFFGGKDQIVKL